MKQTSSFAVASPLCGVLLFLFMLFGAPSARSQQKIRDASAADIMVANQTNVISVKTSQFTGYEIAYHNATGGNIYLHFFDTNGVPGNGAVPNAYIPVLVPTASQAAVPFVYGLPVQNGLVVCASSSRATLTLGSTNGHFAAIYYGRAN